MPGFVDRMHAQRVHAFNFLMDLRGFCNFFNNAWEIIVASVAIRSPIGKTERLLPKLICNVLGPALGCVVLGKMIVLRTFYNVVL